MSSGILADGIHSDAAGEFIGDVPLTSRNALRQVSIAMAVVGMAAALGTFWIDPRLSMIAVAFVFGWTQVATPCGVAIMGALTAQAKPLGKWGQWRLALLAYTLGGLTSSMLVGAALGWLGRLLNSSVPAWFLVLSFTAVAVILAMREIHWLSFPLPQKHRPSIKAFSRFGLIDSAAMWGFHIGLGFNTFTNYGGPYVLMLAIVAPLGGGDPVSTGLTIMGVYWMGRALSAWLAPALGGEDRVTLTLILHANASRPVQQRIQALGLAWSAAIGAYVLLV